MKRQALSPSSAFSVQNVTAGILQLLDDILNWIFSLTHEAATLRWVVVWVLLILIFLFLTFTNQPFENYRILIGGWTQLFATGDIIKIILAGFKLLWDIFFNVNVFLRMLALYAPFWLMERVAAIYLADIFEKDEKVALTFIQQAAFAKSYNKIHIRQGKVADDDQDSPMIQIGGPGYVVVELDSAVVFERPDGSAYVIGPTFKKGKKSGWGSSSITKGSPDNVPMIDPDAREWLEENAKNKGKNSKVWKEGRLVEAFDRIRQGIDLRDVIHKQEVATRSRDGIPVTARDVQYSYSVFRGKKPVKTQKTPFPYDEDAVKNLVYGAIKPVKLNEAPSRNHDWLEPQPSKIAGQINVEISSFVNKRGLSDFLVAVGKPEDESLDERMKENNQRIQTLSGAQDETQQPESENGKSGTSSSMNPVGNVTPQTSATDLAPRALLTKMFYDNFQAKALQRGTQLNWVGVGTWDTPDKIIPRNHQEAWQISRDNLVRSNPMELQRIFDEAELREQIQLIENSVIRKFINERNKQQPEEQVILTMLKEYKLILESARELYRPNIPNEILMAIQEIENWLHPPSYSIGNED